MMYKGTYTLLAQLKEIAYIPKLKSKERIIKFKERWELLWDPIRKILYGVKKTSLKKVKNLNHSKLSQHPSYKMVKIFKDQNVSSAFDMELNKNGKFEKLGKGIHVVYKSDKWNAGEYFEYIHEFGEDGYVINKNHGVNVYYDPTNKIYKIEGGKLNVDERGIIF